METQVMERYILSDSSICKHPLCVSYVPAGFPSPADNYIEGNLNEFLIEYPTATYFVRTFGDSMDGSGIFNGDIIIVDRAIKPVNNKIAVAAVDGELMVKRFRKNGGKIYLISDNHQYKPIEIKEEMNVEIWDTVTTVIHRV